MGLRLLLAASKTLLRTALVAHGSMSLRFGIDTRGNLPAQGEPACSACTFVSSAFACDLSAGLGGISGSMQSGPLTLGEAVGDAQGVRG